MSNDQCVIVETIIIPRMLCRERSLRCQALRTFCLGFSSLMFLLLEEAFEIVAET